MRESLSNLAAYKLVIGETKDEYFHIGRHQAR